MALNLGLSAKEYMTILALAAGILILLFIITYFVEKKVKRIITRYLGSKNRLYLKKIKIIKGSKKSTDYILNASHGVARNFLREYYNLDKEATYEEISEIASKNPGDRDIQEFANRMTDIVYAGRKPTVKEVLEVITLLEKILREKKIERTIAKKAKE